MMKKKLVSLCLAAALAAIAVIGGTLAYFTDTTETVKNTFTMGKVRITLDEAPVDADDKEITGDRVTAHTYTNNMVPGHVYDKDPTIHVEKGSENSYIFLDMTLNSYKSLSWVMAADASADSTGELKEFTIFDSEGALKADFRNASGVFSTSRFIGYMVQNKAIFQAMIDKWFTGIEHENWELCDIIPSEDGEYLTLRFAYQGDTVTTAHSDNDDNAKYTVCAKEEPADIDIQFMKSFQMPASVTQKMIEDGKTAGGMANQFQGPLNMNFTAYAIQADELPALGEAYKAMFDGSELRSSMESINTNP